jgi:tRNA (guanine37-N1)-methyltransferase
MRKVWFISLFPALVKEIFSHGVIGKCFSNGTFELNILNPSDFSDRGFKGVDSSPYGGGPGMVMRADVLSKCLNEGVMPHYKSIDELRVIFPTPRGKKWSNSESKLLLKRCEEKDLLFVCGRYEGVDERFLKKYVDEEFSLGDYVISGGELAASIILDTMLRFRPNVLGNNLSASSDSFEGGLLDSPKYTKPREFEGDVVPEVLLSGDHKKIDQFNLEQMIKETEKYRMDLFKLWTES